MEINNTLLQYTYSLRQAIGISNIKRAVSQDAQTLNSLLKAAEITNAKIMENSVTPYRGSKIDVSV